MSNALKTLIIAGEVGDQSEPIERKLRVIREAWQDESWEWAVGANVRGRQSLDGIGRTQKRPTLPSHTGRNVPCRNIAYCTEWLGN